MSDHSAEVEEVVFKALAKQPSERHRDIVAFATELEKALQPSIGASEEKEYQLNSGERNVSYISPSQAYDPSPKLPDMHLKVHEFLKESKPPSLLIEQHQVQGTLSQGRPKRQQRFPRRTALGGLAGLAGLTLISAFAWQTRPQWSTLFSRSFQGTTSVPNSPTPSSPEERLEFNYHRFELTVHDIKGLLTDSPQAINDIKQQVRSQPIFQNRSVGNTVVYGGAPDTAGIAQAQNIAEKVYRILQMLGREGFAFQRSSYYVPFYNLGQSSNTVMIDVYLFYRYG